MSIEICKTPSSMFDVVVDIYNTEVRECRI